MTIEREIAKALCNTTPRQQYERAVRAERRAEALAAALREIRVRPPSEAKDIARAALSSEQGEA